MVARDAFARWDEQPRPLHPSLSLPPAHPGDPVPLAVDPPATSGLSRDDLAALAADTASRAWELSTGDGDGGLTLGFDDDLARRGAALLDAEASGGKALERLARRAGLSAPRLLRRASAWQQAGRDGVAVLDDVWTPPAERMEEGRIALSSAAGAAVTIRHNRATVLRGSTQLRFGRDQRWYRFARTSGGWALVDGPAPDAASVLGT